MLALNLFWPHGVVKTEAVSHSIKYLWYLVRNGGLVEVQRRTANPEDRSKHAALATSLPVEYSELARQFYSMWNMAIHSYNGDALSIPTNAKDPEMHARLQCKNFLERFLVAHLEIHHSILAKEPGQPNALIAYAAYNWFEVPLSMEFPKENADDWGDMVGGVGIDSPKLAEIFGTSGDYV